jgi:hypothetical protein
MSSLLCTTPNSFVAIILQLPIPKTRLNSIPVFISWQAGVSKLDSILLNWILLYNDVARATQKTQDFYCYEGVFTAPLHSNGSYSIAASVFVVAGMCLSSRCLVMYIYSNFAIPAFGRHVTICFFSWESHETHKYTPWANCITLSSGKQEQCVSNHFALKN